MLLRALKDELAKAKTQGRCLAVVGCRQTLPPELEREFVVLDFALPGKAERNMSRSELSAAILEAQRKNPEQPVLIVGDKNVKYEAVLGVMDELQRQQVKRIGLLVQPTGK